MACGRLATGERPGRCQVALDAFRCAIGSCVVDRTALCAAKTPWNAPGALVGRVRVPAVRLATLGRKRAHKRLGRVALRAAAVDGFARGGYPVGGGLRIGIGRRRWADALPDSHIIIGSCAVCPTDAQLRQHWPRPLATVGGDSSWRCTLPSSIEVRRHSTTTAAVQSCQAPCGSPRPRSHRNALRPSCERAMLSVAAASLRPLGGAPAAGWQAHRRPRRPFGS